MFPSIQRSLKVRSWLLFLRHYLFILLFLAALLCGSNLVIGQQPPTANDSTIVRLKQELPKSKSFKDLLNQINYLKHLIVTNAKNPSIFTDDAMRASFNDQIQAVNQNDSDKVVEILNNQFNNGKVILLSLDNIKNVVEKFRLEYASLLKLPQSRIQEILTSSITEFLRNTDSLHNGSLQKVSDILETPDECLVRCEVAKQTDRTLCAEASAAKIVICAATALGGIIACAATTVAYPLCVAVVLAAQAACEALALVQQEQCNVAAQDKYDACIKACPCDGTTLGCPPTNLRLSSQCESGHNTLRWETISVIKFSRYAIESSADGLLWKSAGFVDASSTSSTPNNYSFTDINSNTTSNFYRLIATQTNGGKTYSTLVGSACASAQNLSIWPNPVNNTATISIPSLQTLPIRLTVTNSQGFTVYMQETNLHLGSNLLNLDMSKLPSGLYILRATYGGTTKTSRIIRSK